MIDGKCSKNFIEHTIENQDGYPEYQRPDNGVFFEKKIYSQKKKQNGAEVNFTIIKKEKLLDTE